MIISPANVSIPVVVPTVNPPTEQVARDNRVREKIAPLRQPAAITPERLISQQDKQLSKPSWDPAQHPDYLELTKRPREFLGGDFSPKEAHSQFSAPRANDTNIPNKEKGYSMRLKLPQEVLDKLEDLRRFRRTGAVVAIRYQQSSVANLPSEVLIVI